MKQSNQIQLIFSLIRIQSTTIDLELNLLKSHKLIVQAFGTQIRRFGRTKDIYGKIKMKRIESQHDEIQEIHS